jgi:hypothetical protein
MSRRAVFSCLSAALAATALAACGSSSSSGGAALAGNPGSASNYQTRLNFAKCMRSHGVNVPDPSANGGPPAGATGGGGFGGGGFRALRSDPNFQSASKACAKYRVGGFGNISSAQRAQFQQAAVKFAECMRSHNVNIPDPSSNGAGGFGIFRNISPTERQSPQFKTAIQACASTLPFRRGGPNGPPPGPGGGGPTT